MNTTDTSRKTTRVLALLWHSPYEYIVSGGFRRTQEILKRSPEDIRVTAIDSRPTMLDAGASQGDHVIEYGFPPGIRRLDQRFFVSIRIFEWLCALASMLVICLRLRFKGERFDSIYVPSSEILPATVAGLFAKLLFRCRLVLCNTNIEFYPWSVRRLLALAHNMSDQVITLSSDLERSLRRNGVTAQVELNAVGLDLDLIEEATAGLEPTKLYDAVFVGRHDQGKGIFDLLRAWSTVAQESPRAMLVTAGMTIPEYAAKIERLIEELGLGPNVLLRGVVDEQEKFRLIAGSKVCLFPSYLEGWGIVPQEALACGLPVVAYDLRVYRENIGPCESVFTVPVGDFGALAEKAVELLSEDSYLSFQDAGPDFVRRFRWADVASREFDIIRGEVRGGTTP